MYDIVYKEWGTARSLEQRRKSFRKWLNAIGADMERKYYEAIENDMTTVEDAYDMGSDHYVCIECTSWGNKVEIYSTASDKICCFPNIEEAILKALPLYDKVVRQVEEDRADYQSLKDTYRGICQDNGWDYCRCNI